MGVSLPSCGLALLCKIAATMVSWVLRESDSDHSTPIEADGLRLSEPPPRSTLPHFYPTTFLRHLDGRPLASRIIKYRVYFVRSGFIILAAKGKA